MEKIFVFISLLFCVADADSQNKTEIALTIRNLEQKAVKGVLEADTNILQQVWAPEFMVNTPRNSIADNRDEVFRNQKAGLINYSSFERIIEKIQIQKKVVITMGFETYVPKTDLQEAKAGTVVKRRFTNVWMKQKGKWLQVARHASIICNS